MGPLVWLTIAGIVLRSAVFGWSVALIEAEEITTGRRRLGAMLSAAVFLVLIALNLAILTVQLSAH
jgi:hypothetical protein